MVGGAPEKTTGGRLFAANHFNGLVDPTLVLTTAACEISPIAKSTLWKIPGLRWLLDAAGAVPIVRRRDDPNKDPTKNEEVFDKVAQHLGHGGNVLVFPEGTSHSHANVLPLKSGAGRMLARAHAMGVRGLTFQAVGLEFEDKTVFRSRALVVYGPVRDVDALWGASSLADAIMQTIADDLRDLVVEASSWDDRLAIACVARLLANESGDRTLAAWNSLGRRVREVALIFEKEDPVLRDEIRTAALAYHHALERAGLDDGQLVRGDRTNASLGRSFLLLLLLPLALVGFLLYAVPYQCPRLVVRLLRGEPDVAATYKLGVGFVAFPLFAVLWTVLAWALHVMPGLATLAVWASPFAALPWLDRLERVSLWSPFRRRSRTRAVLARQRAELVSLVDMARARAEGGAEAPLS